MAMRESDIAEAQYLNQLDPTRALDLPTPELSNARYPLLANSRGITGDVLSPAELAESLRSAYPGARIDDVADDEQARQLTMTYRCHVQGVGAAVDDSGAHAPLWWRATERHVTITDTGVSHVTSEDVDSDLYGHRMLSGGVLLEPFSDPITKEPYYFSDDFGRTYVLPGKMSTYITGLDGEPRVQHVLERAYTIGLDRKPADSFIKLNWESPRHEEFRRIRDTFFPGEGTSAQVWRAVGDARALQEQGVGDIRVIDLPEGYVAVVQQFAQNGRIWMYQYIIAPDGKATHFSYGRSRMFADPSEQAHDEEAEWWVEYTFEYERAQVDSERRVKRAIRRTKAVDAVTDQPVGEVRVDNYTYVEVATENGRPYLVANVKQTTAIGAKEEHKSFNFERDVLSTLTIDPTHITFFQTLSVWNQRRDPAKPWRKGEHFTRYLHYGFNVTEDLAIPMVVIKLPDGSLGCMPVPKKKPRLVSSRPRIP